MRTSSSRIRRPLLTLIIGLVVTFLFAEVSLRIIGWLHVRGRHGPTTSSAEESFKIVFLGNSHTYGSGVAKEETYSHVLGEFLRKKKSGSKIEVFREGILSGTTTQLNERMDLLLPQLRPDLVMIMGGEPNIWNKYGFSEYAAAREKETENSGFGLFLRDVLERSSFFRWLFTLKEFTPRETLSPGQRNDFEVYSFLANYETFEDSPLIKDEGPRMKKSLQEFLVRHEKERPPVYQKVMIILGAIEIWTGNNPSGGLDILERAIKEGPRPAVGGRIIDHLGERDFPPHLVSRFLELRRLSGYEGREKLRGRVRSMLRDMTRKRDLDDAADLIKFYPDVTGVMKYLAEGNLKSDRPRAVEIYSHILSMDPLQTLSGLVYQLVDEGTRMTFRPEVQKKATVAKKKFLEAFPTEAGRFQSEDNDSVRQWVIWDLERLHKKITESGAEAVLQTYHFQNIPGGTGRKELIQAAIAEAAGTARANFLPTHEMFMKEVRAVPGAREKFFVDEALHPSPEGHRMIARIIYDYLNEHKLLPPEYRGLDSKELYRYSWEK